MHKQAYRELVFWIGIIATIAYRIIIALNNLPTLYWSNIAWYVGTIGFVWYFAHRYNVETKRSKMVRDADLIKKIEQHRALTVDDQNVLVYSLKSLTSSKAQWNYIAIFVTSGLALAYDIISRLLK